MGTVFLFLTLGSGMCRSRPAVDGAASVPAGAADQSRRLCRAPSVSRQCADLIHTLMNVARDQRTGRTRSHIPGSPPRRRWPSLAGTLDYVSMNNVLIVRRGESNLLLQGRVIDAESTELTDTSSWTTKRNHRRSKLTPMLEAGLMDVWIAALW